MHRRILLALAFTVLLAGPSGAWAAEGPAKSPKLQHIALGQEIKLTDHLVAGKTTVFDFYSDFCPPCVAMTPKLEKLHQSRADVVVVKVDINRPGVKGIDWKSPVAQQYKLRSIPHLKVFGPDGKLVAEGNEARTMVERWFK